MPPPSELSRLLAESMDADAWLLPYLPELFRDVDALSVRAEDVLAVLGDGGLRHGARLLDLGCGKGAAAIAVCESFAAFVHGVDGLPEFIAHATDSARQRGLSERCTFEVDDVRTIVTRARAYDAVMQLGVGPLFGDSAATIAVLRRCVGAGGLIVLDDAYLEPGAALDPELTDCHDRAGTIQLLEAHGDRVVAERVVDTEDNRLWYQRVTAAMLTRARALAERHPELAEGLLEFAARQRKETEVLSGPLVGALFAVRVGG